MTRQNFSTLSDVFVQHGAGVTQQHRIGWKCLNNYLYLILSSSINFSLR